MHEKRDYDQAFNKAIRKLNSLSLHMPKKEFDEIQKCILIFEYLHRHSSSLVAREKLLEFLDEAEA